MTAIRDDINNSAIIGAGFGTAFLVVFLILALTGWYQSMQSGEESRKSGAPATLQAYKADQGDKLNGYGWVDQSKNKARIPVERAMDLTLREIAAGK